MFAGVITISLIGFAADRLLRHGDAPHPDLAGVGGGWQPRPAPRVAIRSRGPAGSATTLRLRPLVDAMAPYAIIGLLLIAWQIAATGELVMPFLLPAPSVVLQWIADDLHCRARSSTTSRITLYRTFCGFALAAVVGRRHRHPDDAHDVGALVLRSDRVDRAADAEGRAAAGLHAVVRAVRHFQDPDGRRSRPASRSSSRPGMARRASTRSCSGRRARSARRIAELLWEIDPARPPCRRS